jgi:hypothetical protein
MGSRLSAEEHCATIAGACDLALAGVQQMLVDRCKFSTAELAAFGGVRDRATAGNLPEK